MAFQNGAKKSAKGNSGVDHSGPNNKTPAQTQQSPDYGAALAQGKRDYDSQWGRTGYGANAFGGASSDTPGKRTRAALTANNDDTDPVLNAVKDRGLARDPRVGDDSGRTFPMQPSTAGGFDGGAASDPILRDLAAGVHGKGTPGYHDSMLPRGPSDGSPGGSVPSGLTNKQTEPVRKPS